MRNRIHFTKSPIPQPHPCVSAPSAPTHGMRVPPFPPYGAGKGRGFHKAQMWLVVFVLPLLAPQQYRGTRFAVVLFLLLEGESERERSGNPPPPLPPANPLTYPSPLLAVGPPRAPMATGTAPERPKAPKVHLGLPDHP